MPVIVEKSSEMVKRVKVQIGDEWSEVCFGKPLPRHQAWERARIILDSLKDAPHDQ